MRTLLVVLVGLVILFLTNASVVYAQTYDCAQTVMVGKGESLSLLALRYFGDLHAYPTIVQVTNSLTTKPTITDPDRVREKQRVCLSRTHVYAPQPLDPRPGVLLTPFSKKAHTLQDRISVKSFRVDELQTDNLVECTVTVVAAALLDLSSFTMDFRGMLLTRVAVNGGYPFVSQHDGKLFVYLQKPLGATEPFDVQIQYRSPRGIGVGENVKLCNGPLGELTD